MALYSTQKPSPDSENRLAEERLRLVSEYSVTAFCLAILLVFAIAIAMRQHLDSWLIATAIGLVAIYLLQYFLARQFLRPRSRHKKISDWEALYTLTASLSGLFWGSAAASLIFNRQFEADLLVMLFICAITAGVMPLLGILSRAYGGFVLGALLPVLTCLLLRGNELALSLSVFSACYLLLLLSSSASYRGRVDARLREAQETIDRVYRSCEDSLTGLPNRAQFERELSNALDITAKTRVDLTLLYIDLDQFKLINDTRGHSLGDEMLRQVAGLLRRLIRQGDSLARIGGDEFAIMLVDCDEEKAKRVSKVVCRSLKQNRFYFQGSRFHLSASIGLATTASGLDTIEGLLGAAERATYAAKENGRNRVHIFDQHDDLLHQRNQEMHWAMEIPNALSDDRFYLEYQMIVAVDNTGADNFWYEVLLRMRDDQGQVVMPDAFLPAAERYNLAVEIDYWVVNSVLQALGKNPAALDALGLCFINLSGQSLGDPNFMELVCAMLRDSPVPAQRLCFEITETAAVANHEQALVMMQNMRALGCRFALDDFGSGLSSFRYLRNFPVDFIKIDGVFVQDIVNDPINQAIVASISDIGHVTNKKIIAEFVEDVSVLDCLADIGVDFVQGYGIAVPQLFPPEMQSPINQVTNF